MVCEGCLSVCVCVLAEIRLKMLVARWGEKETETVCEISHKLLDRTKVCNKNHNKQVLKQPPPPAPAPLIALHSWHSLKKGNVRQGGGDTAKGAWQAVNLAFLSTVFSSASLTHNFKNYATLLCHAYKQKTAAPLLATMHSYTRSGEGGSSPLRVRSAHCFSEAAKLLIKAFAFYIWRTRTHTHTHTQCTQACLYIYRTYIFISYMGACHLCGRFGHNRAASYATKMRVCSSFSSASPVTRFACHATQSRDFSPTTGSPPPAPLLLPVH